MRILNSTLKRAGVDAKGKMSRNQVIVTSIMFSLITIAPIFAAEEAVDPVSNNKGTIYEYGYDIPDVCFFPIEKAKWNGYEVTTKSWGQLTDFQRVMFISEGITEIEQKNNVKVDDSIKGSPKFILAVNAGVANIEKTVPGENIAMMKFLYDLLQYDKRIVKETSS